MKFVKFMQWSQLPAGASALFEESQRHSLFLSRAWLENLSTHTLREDQSLLLACVVDEQARLLAILPLLKQAQGGLRALSNHYTTHFSLLVCSHCQQDKVIQCLAENVGKLSTQAIQFEPIRADDRAMNDLIKNMQSHGFESYPYFRFYSWIHPVKDQCFAEYMAERPTYLRNTIQRKLRKLQREHVYDLHIYTDTSVDRALLDYNTVYQASWKANELYADFTPHLVRALSKLGWLRLGVLYVDQQAIAAQIWFVVDNKASIYRLVYDQNWKKYSPGSLLTQHLMRHVIDIDKVSEIDFLTGNERYKQDWMTTRKQLIGVRLAKPVKPKSRFHRTLQDWRNRLSSNTHETRLARVEKIIRRDHPKA